MYIIKEFRGKFFFLSNFYMVNVEYNGIKYTNNESAFQSMKVEDYAEQKKFTHLNPSQAKSRGRAVQLRDDWEEIKAQVMYDICLAKFSQNEGLKEALLDTEDIYLEEGNTWGDKIWVLFMV